MFSSLLKGVGLGTLLGFKAVRYFVDSCFRDKVRPVPGSVVYCDLWMAVEHSGIHVGDGQIANIVVDGVAEASVERCDARDFTSKSLLGKRIYVSCDQRGAVGHPAVARHADAQVGERSFYGLVFRNCHEFSTKCVQQAEPGQAPGLADSLVSSVLDHHWEPTLRLLRSAATQRLGATKWRLWDWDKDGDEAPPPEPDWQAQLHALRHRKLDPESIAHIRAELAEMQAYAAEIADEAIPEAIRGRLTALQRMHEAICAKYQEAEAFLSLCPGAQFSYADLESGAEDFGALAQTLRGNPEIRELVRKLGRHHISQEKKKQTRVPQASRSEVHGTHRSDDVMRMLPSELLNLEDETLEALFFARLLEKNLLCYELQGVTFTQQEQVEQHKHRTGPVVACLDTSASMAGAPLHRAKALLLAISGILQSEGRSLHVLLFGESGQLSEFSADGKNDAAGLLSFLKTGFGGGTDFETPLRKAIDIIESRKDYIKADVLMVSDGDCTLSPAFLATLADKKKTLGLQVYSVLCAGRREDDAFSDEVVVL